MIGPTPQTFTPSYAQEFNGQNYSWDQSDSESTVVPIAGHPYDPVAPEIFIASNPTGAIPDITSLPNGSLDFITDEEGGPTIGDLYEFFPQMIPYNPHPMYDHDGNYYPYLPPAMPTCNLAPVYDHHGVAYHPSDNMNLAANHNVAAPPNNRQGVAPFHDGQPRHVDGIICPVPRRAWEETHRINWDEMLEEHSQDNVPSKDPVVSRINDEMTALFGPVPQDERVAHSTNASQGPPQAQRYTQPIVYPTPVSFVSFDDYTDPFTVW
ncbi:hypothetical protein CVT24_007643 [Panaeolus cyanescens]|uniref:Uncharacterized protein n=1 Tax=Panaeolus cyanescens TaxID=181874 RepID=A0A409W4X3_9AGAR|nr:hypothetical protein CVT24_007643 [Panaeolus cyanescens]